MQNIIIDESRIYRIVFLKVTNTQLKEFYEGWYSQFGKSGQMESLVDEKGSSLAQYRIKLQNKRKWSEVKNDCFREECRDVFTRKEKETSAGFIYLLVLFITYANLLSVWTAIP